MLNIHSGMAQGQYCPRYLDPVFSQVLKLNNITYGQNRDLSLQMNDLVLDFYTPIGDNLTKRPLVILLHGGDFVSGTKNNTMMLAMCDSLARKGYTCASLDYTLLPSTNPFLYSGDTLKFLGIYMAQQDAKAAVRYFKKNAAIFKIDTSNIFLGGTSAGAAAAVHAAYMDQDEAYGFVDTLKFETIDKGNNGSPNYSSKFKAVVNCWGYISDTSWIENGDHSIVSIHGLEDSTVPCALHNFSPMIPYAGSCAMKAKLETEQIENSLLTYPEMGHGHATTSGKMKTTVEAIATFLYNEVAICNLPRQRQADKITPQSARFTWQPAPNAEKYIIRIRLKDDTTWTNLIINSGIVAQKTVNNLEYDRDYIWQIRSECASLTPCPSLFSAQDTFHTLCYPPAFASTTVYSTSAAELFWGSVTGAQAHLLRGKKVGNTGWINLYFSRFQTSKQVFGLQAGAQYQWQIKAICDTIEPIFSPWTEMQFFTMNSAARLQSIETEPASFQVFPNPNYGEFTVHFETETKREIEILDLMGRSILQKQIEDTNEVQLKLETQAGVFLIRIVQNGEPDRFRKFVIR